MVRLRQASAGSAHPHRILSFETPSSPPIKKPPDGGFFIGGLEGIRTLDPHNANVVRSQLRYKPVSGHIIPLKESFVKKKAVSESNVIRLVCHPERSAEGAKPKDPFLMDITDSSTRFARSE